MFRCSAGYHIQDNRSSKGLEEEEQGHSISKEANRYSSNKFSLNNQVVLVRDVSCKSLAANP